MLLFIMGIIFAFIGIPILQSLSDMIVTFISIITTKCYEITAKINVKIRQYESEENNDSIETYPIGFQMSEEEQDEEEYIDE